MYVTAVDALFKEKQKTFNCSITSERLLDSHLGALNFQLHVIFPRRLAVLALLPTIAVSPVPNFLARVKKHRAAFRSASEERRENMSILRGLSKTLHHVSSVHFWLGLKAVIENFFGGKQESFATFIYS